MDIFHADKLQNRKSVTCDPRLLTLGRARAEDEFYCKQYVAAVGHCANGDAHY
jgi:hypothetical protein